MPDVRTRLHERLAALPLSRREREKIVDEWAAELEDLHDALRLAGRSDADAWREIFAQLPPPKALGDALAGEPRLTAPALSRRQAALAHLRLWASVPVAGLLGDLRAGVRLLTRAPGYSAAIVLILGVCLGANAAVFTVVDTVLLRPLPVPEPERIVALGDVYPTITPNDILSNDVPSYFDRRQALTAFESQGLFTFWFDTLTIDGTPRELRGMRVTPSLLELLRVTPALGRIFTEAEGERGADQKIILSHALWQQLYAGDSGVIGRTMRLGWTGQAYTIVGVMPEGFTFFDHGYPGHGGDARRVAFWLPLTFTPEQRSDSARTRYGYYHLGRLRPEATLSELQEQLNAAHASMVARFPQFAFAELGMYSLATPLQDALTRSVRRPLYVLWAAALVVLLIGVFNVANLSLARGAGRRRELATRLALGAGRGRVVRQLAVESLVPASVGVLAGMAVGRVLLGVLARTSVADLPRAAEAGMTGTTVAYVAAIGLVMGLVIGVAPALGAGRSMTRAVSQQGSRAIAGGRRARLVRRTLIVAQVALSVVLIVAAMLLLATLRHLLTLDAGFAPAGVMTATIFPPPSRYPDGASVAALQDRVLDRVRAIPGVEAVGLTSNIALSGFESPSTVAPADRRGDDDATVVPSVVAVTPGYFEAMSTPLVRGRDFTSADRADSTRVAIVDRRLAERLWPGTDPLGQQIFRGEAGPYTIVGVVADVRLEGLTGAAIGSAYFPHTQAPAPGRLRWIALKSALDPGASVSALRAALLDIDPDLPIADVQTMHERTAHLLASERLSAHLATLFAAIALLLSLVGLYALLSAVVASRTRELGIRMALGSSAGGAARLVLAEGAALIGIGLALGVAGAIGAARALAGMIVGIESTDLRVFAGVSVLVAIVGLTACLVPARRAGRINPVDVLSAS